MGMLSLLLIQMFPQFLAVVAIYLIMLEVSDIFPTIGLNTRSGVILVYLGGALGVNAWLMKGFFDSIPNGARRVGAGRRRDAGPDLLGGHPPARRARARGDRAALVHLHDQRVRDRRASCCRTRRSTRSRSASSTSCNREYGQDWGPFCAGRRTDGDPRHPPLPLPAAVHRPRAHRLREGMSAPTLADSAPRRLRALRAEPPQDLGDKTTVLPACPAAHPSRRGRRCATSATASRRFGRGDRRPGRRHPTSGGGRASARVERPTTPYRWLLSGGDVGYTWLNGCRACSRFDLPDADDFVLAVARRAGPTGISSSVVYQVFPDRFATSGRAAETARLGGARATGTRSPSARGRTPARVVRRRPPRHRAASRPHRVARRERALPDAVLPGRSTHRYDADYVRPRRSAARR